MATASPSISRPPRKRWFRFSLRTLFVALTVSCLWLGFEVTQARRQRAAVQALEKLGAYVAYDYDEPGTHYESGGTPPRLRTLSPLKQWIADWLGKDYVSTAIRVQFNSPTVNDESLAPLADLPALEMIHLDRCVLVTDATLRNLPSSTRLTTLMLSRTSISDAGLQELERFPALESLDIHNTQVSDTGLEFVGKLTGLTHLDLTNTATTDAGMAHLGGLTRMRRLTLANTKIGDEAFRIIGKYSELEVLIVENAAVTDAGLAHLGDLSKLQGVWLKWTLVHGAGLQHLAHNKGLIVIRLNGCPLTDEAVPAIASASSLLGVDLQRTTLSPKAVAELQALRPKLRITPP